MKKRVFASLSFFLLLLVSCTTSMKVANVKFAGVGRYSDLSSVVDLVENGKIVEGRSCGHRVFLVPVSSRESIDEALDVALLSAPGANALTNVTVTESMPFISLIYNRICFSLSGKAARTK